MNFKKTQTHILKKITLTIFVFFFVASPLLIPISIATAQGAPAATPPAAAPAATAQPVNNIHNGKQADPKPTGSNTSIPTQLGQFLGNLLLNIASIITWAGGMILQTSMDKLIFGMGSLVHSESALGKVIDGLWRTVRDICNLAFIFGFIYIGIRTILDNQSSDTKRMLAQIIIAALLINFSLFFTKAIIEFSNLLATSIKVSMIQGNGSISAHLANLLGISGLFGAPSVDKFPSLTSAGNLWFYFMGAIFLLIAGFVLAVGGILIIIRFVMLVFIMIFSPILFGATIFPQTEQYAKMLWKKLISYSFFAPAYLFMLLLTMHILAAITNMLNPGKRTTLTDALTNKSGAATTGFDSFDVILLFSIAIMFLIASLQVAQKFSVAGADKALNMVKGAGNNILKGTQGYLGRGAITASGAGWVADKIAKKQEEYRNSDSGVKNVAAAFMRGSGVSGAADAVRNEKFGSGKSRADVEKKDKEVDRARSLNRDITETRSAVVAGVNKVAEAQNSGGTEEEVKKAVAEAQNSDEYIKMQRTVLEASHAHLLALLKEFKPDSKEYKEIVAKMSHGQYEKLMDEKDENFDVEKKKKLGAERKQGIRTNLNITDDENAPEIAKASVAQMEMLGTAFLKKNAKYLTAAQMDAIKNSKKFVELEFAAISEARKAAFDAIIANTDAVQQQSDIDAVFEKRKPKDAAQLPKEILTHKSATKNITPDIFGSMIDERVDRTVQQKVYTNVKEYLAETDTLTMSDEDVQKFESMKQFMDTPNIQQRFEARKNDGGEAGGPSEKRDFRSRGTKKRMGE